MRTLPGKPDIVFRAARLAIFCDGDFWHGRYWRRLRDALSHGANATYWEAKIARNRERDLEITAILEKQGWRVLRFWETDILADPVRAAAQIRRCLKMIH